MTFQTAPAYNIPQNFTGIVTDAYGRTGVLLAYHNGEALRGAKGGLRKFKAREAAEAALTLAFSVYLDDRQREHEAHFSHLLGRQAA